MLRKYSAIIGSNDVDVEKPKGEAQEQQDEGMSFNTRKIIRFFSQRVNVLRKGITAR